MAPRKPKQAATTAKSMKASTGAGVAKRSNKKLRFHENGLLNVETQKGKYLRIARQNQRDSPLLRLPAEIRNLIFGYALGGKTFLIAHYVRQGIAKNRRRFKNALASLAVCRQVFAETALLPFSSNTFSALHPQILNMWIKDLPPPFAHAITSVRLHPCIRLSPPESWYDIHDGIPRLQDIFLGHEDKRLSPSLISLKNVQLAVDMGVTGLREDGKKLQESGWQFIKGLYETENSEIEFIRSERHDLCF